MACTVEFPWVTHTRMHAHSLQAVETLDGDGDHHQSVGNLQLHIHTKCKVHCRTHQHGYLSQIHFQYFIQLLLRETLDRLQRYTPGVEGKCNFN